MENKELNHLLAQAFTSNDQLEASLIRGFKTVCDKYVTLWERIDKNALSEFSPSEAQILKALIIYGYVKLYEVKQRQDEEISE